ncbi:hypothetical protein Tco_0935928 [Tanacetum coccineum]
MENISRNEKGVVEGSVLENVQGDLKSFLPLSDGRIDSEIAYANFDSVREENGLQILQSIDQGPFELGTTRNTLGTTPEGGVLLWA